MTTMTRREPLAFRQMVLGGVGMRAADVYAECRDGAPLFWSDTVNAWVLSHHEDVHRALTDESAFGGPLQYGGQPGAAIHGRVLLHMSGEEHRKKVGLISARMRSPQSVRGSLNDTVERVRKELIAALPTAPSIADAKTDFTEPLPLHVITSLVNVHEATRFRSWYELISAAGGGNPRGDARVMADGIRARDELYAFFAPLIVERRNDPGDDLLSDLCSMEYEGEQMTDEEIQAFMSFLLVAGVETTARVMSSMVKELVANPEQWDLLVQDPSLITSAAAEIIRLNPPHHATKRQLQLPVEIQGRDLAAGDVVLAVMGAGNQDDRVFTNAQSFDVTRFRENANSQFVSAGAHHAFGGGRHFCTGSLVAKLEMTSALTGLLERYSRIEFADGEVPAERGWPLRGPESLQVLLHAR
jgi:cytochrome P450